MRTLTILGAVIFGVIVFTVVEVLTLFYWIPDVPNQNIGVLTFGLLVEHGISVLVGVLAGILLERLMHQLPLLQRLSQRVKDLEDKAYGAPKTTTINAELRFRAPRRPIVGLRVAQPGDFDYGDPHADTQATATET